jgi:hypothetical protein
LTIFFRDVFPLTGAFNLALPELGNSGNAELDSFGGTGEWFREPGAEVVPGPGTEEGARMPEAELEAQGVFLWTCLNAGVV